MFSVTLEYSPDNGPSVTYEVIMSICDSVVTIEEVSQISVSGNVNDVPDDEIESLRKDIERIANDCVILTEWAVGSPYADPYQPPETLSILLNGAAQNHPEHTPGKRIWTSPIVDINGRVVTCERRKYYLLGPADKKYLAFCEASKVGLPEGDEPLKMIKSPLRAST